MSESSKNDAIFRFRSVVIAVAVLVFILGLGYISGYFLLPGGIETAYQSEDCDKVLSLDRLYLGWYPNIAVDKVITNLAMECGVYYWATRSEEVESWQDSYNAYRVYLDAYPQGLFIADAHSHAANALVNLVKNQISRDDFSEAIINITSLLNEYGDTEAATETEKLRFDLYLSLGVFLRETGDYIGAEQVFRDVNGWALAKNDTEYFKLSQLEISQTYLDWGMGLQAQEKFTEANARFDTAISNDPDPSSAFGPASQAKNNRVELYTQWGDYLIRQGDFANAMGFYETAGTLSINNDPSTAKDIIANGYLRWASEAIAGEDFIGALVLLDSAENIASTDSTKDSVNGARVDLYVEFSKSRGKQAQRAMDDAIRVVCEHHIQPRLLIFGVDGEDVGVGLYGINERLPDSMIATTPGSLHYVACVEKDSKLVSTVGVSVSSQQFNPNAPPGIVHVDYHRIKNIWNITLMKVDTGDEIDMTIIEGGEPPNLRDGGSLSALNWYGSEPDFTELVNWVQSILK